MAYDQQNSGRSSDETGGAIDQGDPMDQGMGQGIDQGGRPDSTIGDDGPAIESGDGSMDHGTGGSNWSGGGTQGEPGSQEESGQGI